ncbi:MAG: hypothetical protein JWQ63_1486 [Mucilaginibacter sp.]|nr:hypothetical protein [Mucilaginibacter sp.]
MMSENNESIIYSEPVNKILENSDIFFFKWGLLIFLFFIFVLLGLAVTVKYPDKIILPQGRVSSVPQTQSIIYSTVIGKPQVDKIKIGARALFYVDNNQFPEHKGTMEGVVSWISKIPSKNGDYAIQVQLKNSSIIVRRSTSGLKTDMVTSVEVLTNEITLIGRLFNQKK